MDKKRLLYIGHPHATPDKEDWYKALQKKYDCTWLLRGGCAIPHYAVIEGSDIVYIHAGAIEASIVREIKHNNPNAIIIQWGGDIRDEVLNDYLVLKGLVDISFVPIGDGPLKKAYEKELGRVEWIGGGIPEWMFRPLNPNAEGIIFVGNNYDQFSGARDRCEIAKKLKKEYGDLFKVYGNGWGDIGEGRTIPYEELPDYYSKAYIGIDGNIFNDKPRYYSGRILHCMAASSLCMVRQFPGHEELFPFPYSWNTFESLKEQIDWLLLHREERNKVASEMNAFMRENNHIDKQVENFNKIIYG